MNEEQLKSRSFQDSKIDVFKNSNTSAKLIISDVRMDYALTRIVIEINGLETLEVNKGRGLDTYEPTDRLSMLGANGNVLVLKLTDNTVTVVITWNSYQPRKTLTESYRIRGKTIHVEESSPYPDYR